jgi:CDP-diacylglycerol--serine O-phosphatidyltransferase
MVPRTLWRPRLRRTLDTLRPGSLRVDRELGRTPKLMIDPKGPGRGRWAGRLRGRVLRVRRIRGRTARPEPRMVTAVREPLLPGPRTGARRARFAAVTVCTLASLTLGLAAILLAMRGEVALGAGCVLACVVLDGLDGALARRLSVASPFGAQMDSLADMCAFGIAAPVLVYTELAGQVPPPAAAGSVGLVAACAAVRLARFNVSPKDCRFFAGVPTTMAAAVLAVAVLVDPPLAPPVLVLAAVVLALGMVSTFPYPTVVQLLRLPAWLWLLPVAGAVVDARTTLLALGAGYLAIGPAIWLHRLAQRQRAIGVTPPSTRSSGATSGSAAPAGR